ncbi:MAG: hypothetical protein JRG76_01055 [Deltaproteobacteria bacterium]|nr:hypothetical protein [Deltaproteobacteria bacterium]MBW2413071.1 hypothetical protein [Deltaproteobacteria bacterium]
MDFPALRIVVEGLAVTAVAAAAVWQVRRAARLRDERDHARAALESLPARAIAAGPDMRVAHVNAAARRAGGAGLEGRGVGTLLRDPHAMSRILASPGVRAHLEPVSICGEDAVLRLCVLRDASGDPSGAVATWTTTEETQEQQRAGLRSTLDRIPLNALLVDRDGRVAHVNRPGARSLRRLCGGGPADWAGKPLSELFGVNVPFSMEDEQVDVTLGEDRLEVSTMAMSGSRVVTPGWLVLWRSVSEEQSQDETVQRTVHELGSATEELTAAARELIANSDTAAQRATRMLDRTREVTDNTHSVANATEQMSGTVNEISLNTRELAEGIVRAVSAVERSKEIADGLCDSAREISRVSETISDITDQTNLLALNATIEAAGAGDAGRGFAVVANEVKELARETMSATGAIDAQVQRIIKRSEDVAAAVSEVAEVVQGVHSLAATLATAIEEQSNATDEIASSVSYAAESASEIGREMETLFEAARSSTQTAESVRAAAEQLNEMARALEQVRVSSS